MSAQQPEPEIRAGVGQQMVTALVQPELAQQPVLVLLLRCEPCTRTTQHAVSDLGDGSAYVCQRCEALTIVWERDHDTIH